MKNLRYPLYFLLSILLLLVSSCASTKPAVEKARSGIELPKEPQSESAVRVEQQNTASQNSPSVPGAAKTQRTVPDAVSGATTDAVSGATMSRNSPPARGNQQADSGKQLPKQQELSIAANTDKAGRMTQTSKKPPVENNMDQSAAEEVQDKSLSASIAEPEQKTAATLGTTAVPVAASAEKKMDGIPEPADMSRMAVNRKPGEGQGDSENTAQPAEESIALTESPEEEHTGKETDAAIFTAAKTSIADETGGEQETESQAVPLAAQTYEDTLADIISDFEEQGGTHGYEAPRSFHEEMLDLFSPQIFTVALSKEPETEQKVKVSRMVAVEEKQRLELTYPGHGWVYVGEQTAQQGLKYEQRKLQDNNSIFMFIAEKKGDYVLHFSYFDVFTNDFITDAVAVSVSAARSTAAKSMVRAPDYKNSTETAESEQQPNAQATADGTDLQTNANAIQQTAKDTNSTNTAAVSTELSETMEPTAVSSDAVVTASAAAALETAESLDPEQLLEKARTAIGAADAATALQYLDQFFTTSTQSLDEGWFLQGRAYELNGSVRNIRRALAAYKTLTNAYPQSKYWAEADARIRYITSFYINIQ